MSFVTRGFHGRRRDDDGRLPPGQHLTGDFPVLSSQIYLAIIGQYDIPRGAALAVILLLPAVLLFSEPESDGQNARQQPHRQHTRDQNRQLSRPE